MHAFALKRVYEPPDPKDGARVLVDRLWPRGLKKEEAAIDLWVKDLAPSNELRKWFGHEPERWPEFQKRYRKELEAPEAREQIDALRTLAHKTHVTLLFAAHDETMNNAVVLGEVLRKRH